MPFDTLAWLSMPGVRGLSPELRSLWLDLLCLMWGSVERGVLLKPNGDRYSRGEINRLLAINDDGVIETLIDAGLCAWREDGALFSREIIKGESIRAKRREAGLKGGNATKAKIFSPPPDPPKEKAQEIKVEESILPLIEEPPQEELPPPLSTEEKAKAEKNKKYQYADYVSMTQEEYAKLCEKYGEDETKGMIDLLSNYIGSKGCYSKYKSHYRAILSWVADAYYERQQRYGTRPPTITTTPKSAGGTPATTGYATGALQAPAGAGPQSGDAQEEGYAERF